MVALKVRTICLSIVRDVLHPGVNQPKETFTKSVQSTWVARGFLSKFFFFHRKAESQQKWPWGSFSRRCHLCHILGQLFWLRKRLWGCKLDGASMIQMVLVFALAQIWDFIEEEGTGPNVGHFVPGGSRFGLQGSSTANLRFWGLGFPFRSVLPKTYFCPETPNFRALCAENEVIFIKRSSPRFRRCLSSCLLRPPPESQEFIALLPQNFMPCSK